MSDKMKLSARFCRNSSTDAASMMIKSRAS